MATVTSVGAIGDMVAMLPTLRLAGGRHQVYLRGNYIVRSIPFIRSFFQSQSCVASLREGKPFIVDWRSEGFRGHHHIKTTPLAECHARHAMAVGFIDRLPELSQPWVECDPNPEYSSTVIINRTPRYNNPLFPWREVVEHIGGRAVFVGKQSEHRSFVQRFGFVRRHDFPTLLEVCRAIRGAALFIGNQSSCAALAEGMKVPRIVECDLVVPDCVYPPSEAAQYVFDGSLRLPEVAGRGSVDFLPHPKSAKSPMERVRKSLAHSGHQVFPRRAGRHMA